MEYKLYNNINEIQGSANNIEIAKLELYALWQECFGDSKAYTDFYFNWKVKENQILSIYKEDELSSMLHLNPYVLMAQGKIIPANYIVGVATRQQDRRQGLMKMLLETSLRQMFEKQMPFTYLMPAAEAIYLPYGFRIIYEQEPWNQTLREERQKLMRSDFIPKKVSDRLTVIALGVADKERIDELVVFSNQQLSHNYDVYTLRTPYYYNRLIHEMKSTGGEVLLCYRTNQLVGYASYMAEDDSYVTECIYNTGEKESVMNAISEFTESIVNWNKIKENTESHTVPTIMVRIVDWKSFVQNISATEDIILVIEVKDPIIEENNGVYQLQFTTHGCEVVKSKKEPEVSADIADLSRLFFGRMKETDITGIIIGANQEEVVRKLDKISVYKKTFINEVV